MKHTKGECITKYREAAGWEVYNEDGNTICSMGWYQFHNSAMNPEIEEANAKLITEAFNVTNETGYAPRQLADQKADLLASLQNIANMCKDHLIEDLELNPIEIMENAESAILKATS